MNPITSLQNQLATDSEIRNEFLEQDYSSDSDDTEVCTKKIIHGRNKRDSTALILEQLVRRQEAFDKAQRQLFKTKTELECLEVKDRYLKLDLNNALLDKQKLEGLVLYKYESWAWRTAFTLMMFYKTLVMVGIV